MTTDTVFNNIYPFGIVVAAVAGEWINDKLAVYTCIGMARSTGDLLPDDVQIMIVRSPVVCSLNGFDSCMTVGTFTRDDGIPLSE